MKLYPICRRICLKKEQSPKHVGRLATDCFLLNEDKVVIAFGRAILTPTDKDDKNMGYVTAINKAIDGVKASRRRKGELYCSQLSRFCDIPTSVAYCDGLLIIDDFKLLFRLSKIDLSKRKPIIIEEEHSENLEVPIV